LRFAKARQTLAAAIYVGGALLVLGGGPHETATLCDKRRLEAVGGVELAENVRDVNAGRVQANQETLGELPVRAALHEELGHLELAGG